MSDLRDDLVSHGVENLSGWKLATANGISADGRTIIGHGINPLGRTEAWVATVLEPSTFILAAVGGAVVILAAGR